MKNLVLVFALLLTLACCTTEADRNRMRAGLDSINIRNRNGQPFTVSDVSDQGTGFLGNPPFVAFDSFFGFLYAYEKKSGIKFV